MEGLPHWEQGTPAVLCVAGPHAIPVSTAVRDEVLVGVGVIVIGVSEPPRYGHGQPPAIAGSRRTSSVSATGVSRPAR